MVSDYCTCCPKFEFGPRPCSELACTKMFGHALLCFERNVAYRNSSWSALAANEECSTKVANILMFFTRFFGWKIIPRALSVNLTELTANCCESAVRNPARLFGCQEVREACIKADKMGPCSSWQIMETCCDSDSCAADIFHLQASNHECKCVMCMASTTSAFLSALPINFRAWTCNASRTTVRLGTTAVTVEVHTALLRNY